MMLRQEMEGAELLFILCSSTSFTHFSATLESLLDNGANIDARDDRGITCLQLLLSNPQVDVLFFKPLFEEAFSSKLFESTLKNKNATFCTKEILWKRIWNEQSLLQFVCSNKKVSVEWIEYLLGKGVDPNLKDKSYLPAIFSLFQQIRVFQ